MARPKKYSIPNWAYLIPNGCLFQWKSSTSGKYSEYTIWWDENSPRKWLVRFADSGSVCVEDYLMQSLHHSMEHGSLLDGQPLSYWEDLERILQPPEDEDIDVEILI